VSLLPSLLLGAALAAPSPPKAAGLGLELPPVAPLPAPAFPVPTLHHLESGAPVWLVHRPDLPLVRVEVSLRGGQVAARRPLALQAAGALLDQGTAGHPGPTWQAAAGDLGARTTLGVGTFRAWVDVEVLSGGEGPALALLAEAIDQPELDRAAVRRLRRAWRRSGDDSDRSLNAVTDAARLRAELPPEHPLGAIWGDRDYRRLRPGRLRRAWRRQRAAAGVAVVVVGDASADRILPLLERHLGHLSADFTPARLTPPPARGPQRLLVDLPGLEQARVVLTLPAPGIGASDAPATDLVVHALCGAFTSRLNLRLRERDGLTYGASCRVEARPGYGRLIVEVPTDASDVGAVVRAIEAELGAAVETLPTAAEHAAARRGLLVAAARDQLEGAQVAWVLGAALTHGRAPAAAADDLRALGAVSVEDARSLAAATLGAADRTWLFVGDARTIEPALHAVERPPDRVWPAATVVAPRR